MTLSVQTIFNENENQINLLMIARSQALLNMFEFVLPKEKKINYLDCQASHWLDID